MASAATLRPQQFLPCNKGRIKLRHGEPQRRFNFTNKSIVTSAALQHDSSVVENKKKGNIGAAFVKHLTNFGRDGMSPVKTELAKALEVKITALEKQDIKDINTKAEKLAELTLEEILIHNFMEKSIKEAVNEAATSVSSELSSIAEEARLSVEAAKASAKRAEEALTQKLAELDKLPKPEFELLNLEESISSLEQQLEVSTEKVASLQKAAEYATSRAEYAEAQAAKLEDDVRELRRKAEEGNEQRIQNFKNAVETLRKTAEAREQALKSSYEAQLEALRATIEASAKAEKIKEQANLRRFQALENALAASEASLQAWKEQALSGEKGDADLLKGGGRMTTLLGREKLADFVEGGPRTDTPDWIKKRIDAALQGIPPRTNTPEVIQDDVKHLELPSLEDVWSVAKAKVKQDDLYSKDVAAKETLDKQRRDLEHALEQTTIRKRKFIKETPHESGTGSGREIVLQGFNWESCRKRWYNDLAPKAADLSQCGITTVWLPPPTESVAPQGYMPVDLYNLNSAYGTKDELKHCIQEMHKHDLKVLGDVVLNHRCAHKQNANGIWNVFGGKLAWGPEAIVSDDPNFHGRGNPSSGDIFHAAPNIDHSQAFVREDIKEYLLWLKNEMGFDGWRLDFVRGFWGGHVKEYIEASEPAFAIGEYWDSLQYEGGNVAYNQDAHRQRIIDWINATGGTSSAFDVTTKGILHAALHNEYWRLIDPRGKPPGVLGWWSSRAVTFLENHDTGSTQGHWPFPRDKLLQGYAYILTHPGTPVVFYDHFYDFGLRDPIVELITARNRTGIHCRSPLKICHATNDGYVAKVDDRLVVKLGRLDWNPSKQNDLIGNWKRTVDKGCEYQVWEKE